MLKKFLKTLLIFTVLLSVALASLVVFLTNLDLNNWRPEIEQFVHEQTNRPLKINGNLSLELSLEPKLYLENIEFANPSWSDHPNALSIGKANIILDISRLFLGLIDISSLEIQDVYVLLETTKSGAHNFDFLSPKTSTPKTQTPPLEENVQTLGVNFEQLIADLKPVFLPLFHHVDISNITIEFFNHQLGLTQALELKTLSLIQDQTNNRVLKTHLDMQFQGHKISADGVIGAPGFAQSWPINLRMDVANTKATIEGSIDNIADLSGLDIRFNLMTSALEELAHMSSIAVPIKGPASLNAHFINGLTNNNSNNIAVQTLDFILGDTTSPLVSKLQGSIGNLLQLGMLNLSGTINMQSIDDINQWNDAFNLGLPTIPALGKIFLDFELQGDATKDSLSPLSLKSKQLEVGMPGSPFHAVMSAATGNVFTLNDTHFALKANALHAQEIISQIATWHHPKFAKKIEKLPLGKLSLNTHIAGSGKSFDNYGVDMFHLEIGQEKTNIWLNLTGSAGSLKEHGFFQGDVHFQSSDLNAFSSLTKALFYNPKPTSTAFSFNGRFGQDVNLNPFSLELGDSDIGGKISIDISKSIPSISASLTSQKLNLLDFNVIKLKPGSDKTTTLHSSTTHPSKQTKPTQAELLLEPKTDKLHPLSKRRIHHLDGLSLVNGQLDFVGEQIAINDSAALSQVTLQANLFDSKLNIKSLRIADSVGGSLDASMIIKYINNTNTKPVVDIKTKINTDNIRLDPFASLANLPPVLSGAIAGNASLEMRGNSWHDFAQTLNGSINVADRALTINLSALLDKQIFVNSFLTLINAIKGVKPDLTCFIYGTVFKDGIGNIEFLKLNTANLNAKAHGTINLPGNNINLHLHNRLNILKTINIQTNIHASGHLLDPQFSIKQQHPKSNQQNQQSILTPLYVDQQHTKRCNSIE